MWFEQKKIEALAAALKSGQKEGIENILHDVLTVGTNPDPTIPTFCPRCGKPFIQKPLLYFMMGVKACPDGHGVWISRENARKIKLYFEQHLPASSGRSLQKIKSFRVFAILAAIALSIFNSYQKSQDHDKVRVYHQTQSNDNYKTSLSMPHTQKVSPQYWPTRDFSQWNAFPENQNVITDPQELEYVQAWMVLVNEGIINRLNMQDAMLVPRPADEYIDVYYFYADKQNEIIHRLRDVYPPERLQNFHEDVLDAMTNQVAFYEDYSRRKADEPALNFDQLLQHPKLRACDEKLWAAFHEFERVYPSRDPETNNAIEQRLCWLDMI